MSDEKKSRGSVALKGLTPLVDTLFILLFCLLALSDSRQTHAQELLRIQLPEVAPSDEPVSGEVERLVLEIGADSRVRLREDTDDLLTRDELDRALARVLAARNAGPPEAVVIEIHADRDARHGVAVELLQHLRTRGFVTIQLVATGREDLDDAFGGAAR